MYGDIEIAGHPYKHTEIGIALSVFIIRECFSADMQVCGDLELCVILTLAQ